MKTVARFKKATLVAAVSAAMGLAFTGEAAASVYAGSRLLIKDLLININASGGGATSYDFQVNASATLKNSPAPASSGGNLISCSGEVGGATDCNTDPNAGPVLGALTYSFGAPASATYDFKGPGVLEYGTGQSEITTATLVDAVPTSTKSLSEAEIQPSGNPAFTETAGGTAGVFSNTVLSLQFTIPDSGGQTYPGTLTISFWADPDLLAAINVSAPPTLLSQSASASVTTSLTLTKDGSNDKAVWSPDGDTNNGCSSLTTLTCSNETDTVSLNAGVSVSTNNDSDSHSYEVAKTDWVFYAISINGLTAGTWNLVLDADTNATVRARSVPEPGVLALLGVGLLGFGLNRRNQKTKQA